MWKLNTQLVKDDHMTRFEMLMYGVFFDWLTCRVENPPRLASSGCMRLPHTHTHGVVISVLADLLMLTCSACLLGSWGSILCLSFSVCLFLSHFSPIHSFLLILSFSNSMCDFGNVTLDSIFNLTICFMSHMSQNACGYPRCMNVRVCVWVCILPSVPCQTLRDWDKAGPRTSSLLHKPRLLEDLHLTHSWLFENIKITPWFIQVESSLRFLYKSVSESRTFSL